MIHVIASNQVLKFKKKASPKFQLEIDKQVKSIMENPEIGQLKKGDLKGIRVSKFEYNKQWYLFSYEINGDILNLLAVSK